MIRTLRQWFRASDIWKKRSLYKSQRLISMTTHERSGEQYIGWHDEKECAFCLKLGELSKCIVVLESWLMPLMPYGVMPLTYLTLLCHGIGWNTHDGIWSECPSA